MNRHPDVRLVSSTSLFQGRIFRVLRERVRLPSELEQELEIVEHDGATAIAPQDEQGRLLLVRQYRHATGEWLLEIPAGRIEAGEDPAQAARRELEEETGFRAASWSELARFYPAPGFCSEFMTLFLARDLVPVGADRRAHDADEELELERLWPREVLAQSRDAKTLLAAALLA